MKKGIPNTTEHFPSVVFGIITLPHSVYQTLVYQEIHLLSS